MPEKDSPFLFTTEQAVINPARDTQETRWDFLAAKLDAFYQAGGSFRYDTIGTFEKSHGYSAQTPGFHNNCYSSALGALVTGQIGLRPGTLAKLKPVPDRASKPSAWILYGENTDRVLRPHINRADPQAFEQIIQDGLASDGVKINVQLNEIDAHFPIIGYSYDATTDGSDIKMDYHFAVVHLGRQRYQEQPNYYLSERFGRKGIVRTFESETEFARFNLKRNCFNPNVYFVNHEFLGQKIHMTQPSPLGGSGSMPDSRNRFYYGPP